MSPQRNCLLLALGGVVIPYLCEVIAQIIYRETLDVSLKEGLGGILWFAAPFLAVAFGLLFAPRALPARRHNGLFLGALSALGGWYLFGYFGFEQAMRDHHWTAATLGIAFLPVTCLPALGVGMGLGWFLTRHPSSSGSA